MRNELIEALIANQPAFDLDLSQNTFDRLADYYEIVQEHNPLLHLIAPCSAEEFAVRHILESLFLTKYLPPNARFADVGAGAGLPSIPCLIAREDLSAVLIESKEKKARFLELALDSLGLTGRAAVINRQFEEVNQKDFTHITSRALDKFTEKLPRLIKWAARRELLLFGGPSLEAALVPTSPTSHETVQIPLSLQRYIFIVRRSTF